MSEILDGEDYGPQEIINGRPQSSYVTGGDAHDHSGGDGAQIDHGGLGGLTDDDHTQYSLRALDPTAGGSDHSFDGPYAVLTAGETVNFGDVCYLKTADSELYLADASATTTMPAIVMALATITNGNTGNFLKRGYVRDDSWNWASLGQPIFVTITGTTGNTLSQTAPSGSGEQVQIVGYAVTADIMWFEPNLTLLELV
jgi:hypothetical protein